MNRLTKGQRIDLYEIISPASYRVLRKYGHKGKQAIGYDAPYINAIVLRYADVGPQINRAHVSLPFLEHELKKIGTFIVREINTNTDPVTII